MGLLNICSAFVTFSTQPQTACFQLFLYAGRRVINRSEIPLRATALALLLYSVSCSRDGHFIPQKFDSVLRTPLRMTLGGKDAL